MEPKAALSGFSRSPPCVVRPQVDGVLKIMWARAGARNDSRRAAAAAGRMGECMVVMCGWFLLDPGGNDWKDGKVCGWDGCRENSNQ